MVDSWQEQANASLVLIAQLLGIGKAPFMGDIASWAFVIGLLLVLALPLALAIASLWLWGGARRGALGHLMAGAPLMMTGAIFLYVFQFNVFARMDDLWAWDNTGFGGYFMLLGMILLIGSLAGYGVRPWIAALLWVASALFGWLGVTWLAKAVAFPDGGILLYTALLLGGVLLYIVARGYLLEALIAVTLTTLGFALVWRIADGNLRAFTPVTIVAEQYFYKPPLLGPGPLFACLLTATVLFFAGRYIQGLLRRQPEPPVPADAAFD
jgi:hypothetical protein